MRQFLPLAGMALIALAGCTGQTPDSGATAVPKDPTTAQLLADPQPMGTVSLTRGTTTQAFTTFDFASGKFNATSWFGHRDAIYYLNVRAYPNKDPKAVAGLLSIVATLPDAPLAGMTSDKVTVKLIDHGPIADVPRWSSIGKPAQLTITSLVPQVGSSPPATKMTGTLTATLCNLAAPTDQPDCIDLTGDVSTLVQYNYQ